MSMVQTKNTSTTDKAGRPWAKLSELRSGDRIELDGGFTCRPPGPARIRSEGGKLYFYCDDGKHLLEGQADDGEHLVGIYKVEA